MSTATEIPVAADAIAADLLLLRMSLPNPTPKAVREDINKLLESELSKTDFDETRNQLMIDGFLQKGPGKSMKLAEAGRTRAFRFIGVNELPPKTTWSTLISKYLFPKAAEISSEAAAKLKDAGTLSAFMLKRKYDLRSGAGSTVNQVLEAIACKEIGFPEETTLSGLLCTVLSKMIGSQKLKKEDLIKQLPLFGSGLSKASAEGFRSKVVGEWLSGRSSIKQPPSAPPSEQLDLAAFAATVKALAASSAAEDRFHDNKVFISALWRSSQSEPSFPRLTLPIFKQLLTEANSHGLLNLSRADLVQAMEQQQVADSETEFLNATFHFVLVEGGRE